MADFSKQWTERNSELKDNYDFDIIEILENLEPGYYTSIICEGYGFAAIAKDASGNCLLAMPIDNSEIGEDGISIEWKKYEDIVK